MIMKAANDLVIGRDHTRGKHNRWPGGGFEYNLSTFITCFILLLKTRSAGESAIRVPILREVIQA